MVTDDGWIDLRAPGSGRLLARYDPGRRLLEIRRGDDVVLFDLQRQRIEGADETDSGSRTVVDGDSSWE